jgi:hypothetical protein
MAQLFSPCANVYSRVIIARIIIFVCGVGWATSEIFWSPYTTYVGVPLDQPVPFSHKHHVADDGIDCRYCHSSVEKSAFAGMPSSETCMTCHSQIFSDAPMLAPVRQSLSSNTPLKWNRVNDLPDFVYFNHSIHIAKGIGCSTCHGRVDQMPITLRLNTLYILLDLFCVNWTPRHPCLRGHWDIVYPGAAGLVAPDSQLGITTQWRLPVCIGILWTLSGFFSFRCCIWLGIADHPARIK